MRARTSFRFIRNGAEPPPFNMAVDEILFRNCCAGGEPFLRLYEWDPPGLSLGRFQRDFSAIRFDYCREAGIPVVRRLTGGRAVLHHRELTYSIASRYEYPFNHGTIQEVYDLIAGGISAGLKRLGISADLAGARGRSPVRSPNCFASPSRSEIVWQGRKLVGSAQFRERDGFLQHGSIIINVDVDLWESVFKDGRMAREWAAGLNEILGREVSRENLAECMKNGFKETLQIDCLEDNLTREEREGAARLMPRYLKPL